MAHVVEAVRPRRQLRVLRRVEPPLRAAHRVHHDRQPGLRLPRSTAPRTGARRSCLALAAIAVDLGVLGYFKYYGFFSSSLVNLLGDLGVRRRRRRLVQVVLPVGISFFTFQAISYVIDVYRRDARAGPAARLRRVPGVLPAPRGRPDRAGLGVPAAAARAARRRAASTRRWPFWLIVARPLQEGRDRRLPVAATSSTGSSPTPASTRPLEILLGVYGYAIQIYSDFSGYTDIAIGCALLLGFRFPAELRRALHGRPRCRTFWRRWHMTLSRWLRDYLYIPLGGNREGERRGPT